jgi:predicted RND superfamily exporter protein
MNTGIVSAIEGVIFRRRGWVLCLLGVVTLFLAYQTLHLRVDAGFQKLLPVKHPYIKTYLKHHAQFGGANRVLVAVSSENGDIFTPECIQVVREVTEAVFVLPGIDRSTVQSIFTPNVRFVEIVEGGFAGGNVVPADFRPTPEYLATVRTNVIKAGIVGRLVAKDFSAALVSAQLVEIDPETHERLDYLKVARLLETEIRQRYTSEAVEIHIIGFAKAIGDIAEGASGVVLFFLFAFVITGLFAYLFVRSIHLAILPLFCSAIAVLWDLGLLHLFGLGLDPMSLLVPFLVFAIGVSHGVQMINAMRAGLQAGADSELAARQAFRRLVVPGSVALASDAIGFLTIFLIEVRIIQELALTASIGVAVITITNLLLLPLLLPFVAPARGERPHTARTTERGGRVWRWAAGIASPRPALVCVVLAALMAVLGVIEGRDLEVGDLHEGVPELRQSSRYNRDAAAIVGKFAIGLDVLTTIVETIPDGCVAYDVMDRIDHLEWQVGQLPGVQSTLSLARVAKRLHSAWNEGHPKWQALPRNRHALAQSISTIETSTGLLNGDCSVLPVMAYLEDHRAETIERVVEEVQAFALAHGSERHRFCLASGNAGVMAATNEVVAGAQTRVLIYIFAAVATLCLLAFRSWRAVLCIVLPLGLVSVLSYALMSLLEIGLKTSTLPVVALGAGIGVDYGIYIFSRMRERLGGGAPLREAYHRALRVAGSAVLMTALTLSVGVGTWLFSALKFQADMGLLLGFMFLANMLGALILLPSLAVFLLGSQRAMRHGPTPLR